MQNQLETMFERMGARVRVRDTFSGNRGGIDIRSDRHGEYFDIGVGAAERVEYEVIDIQPRLRHLLLMARRERGKQKFLLRSRRATLVRLRCSGRIGVERILRHGSSATIGSARGRRSQS